MSQLYIEKYQRDLARLKRAGKTKNESSIRKAFLRLVENYAESYDLTLVDELALTARAKPDATLRSYLGLDVGYVENKDMKDDIEVEIAKKIERGYPLSNILFENSEELVFYQHGTRIAKISLDDDHALDKVLQQFVSYKRPEETRFGKAIEAFKSDVPIVLKHLREMIDTEYQRNHEFQVEAIKFLENCRKVISPDLMFDNIREMIIQHILTEDIFSIIFGDPDFHRENNIARELSELIQTFFKKDLKRNALDKIHHYYDTIRITAAAIDDHGQKQDFLKTVYEEFYKAYNPSKADKQGIVYTPLEAVRFMIAACDHLLYEHFNKTLASKNVEILDPCTGTGVFITEILRHMEGQRKKLADKYENEIHCNEMDLLPYYIANLNIEYIYKQIKGEYKEFPNICLVDTLDNLGFDKSGDLWAYAGLSEENLERVKRQNAKKISVIIGNPPYNANQQSENDNNKNRKYPRIDKRIKDTYVKESTAQKTKQYDMYKRFIRWASDRIQGEGIVAFITNNAFLDAKQDDGFRKVVAEEFNEIYIYNLKGNARLTGEAGKRQGGSIFNIMVGVSITLFVKRKSKSKCRIFYTECEDYASAKAKKNELVASAIDFEGWKKRTQQIFPDDKHRWLGQTDNDFDDFIPLLSRNVKAKASGSDVAGEENALFKLFSNGISTNRDDWLYDLNIKDLEGKVKRFTEIYNQEISRRANGKSNDVDLSIKWSETLKRRLENKRRIQFSSEKIICTTFRPFSNRYLYYGTDILDRPGQFTDYFGANLTSKNLLITFSITDRFPFSPFISDQPTDLNLYVQYGCICVPAYYYDKLGVCLDNISNWGLKQFQRHYQDTTITKEALFYYVYAVLNNPDYKEKYADNLKVEYPRIPFYDDFYQWVTWGKALIDLHINYERVKQFEALRITGDGKGEKPLLKLDKDAGVVILDSNHVISGIPLRAFDYKLGNRSPIEWVLTGYKPQKYNPDKEEHHRILAAEFNHYDWSSIRTQLLNLIPRLVTLSLETQDITDAMRKS
jgi:predicted helicase